MTNRRSRWWLLAVMLCLALLAGACGGDDDEGGVEAGDDDTSKTTEPPPEFPAGSPMAAIQQKGKLVVGTKYDQPGFGLKNPTTNEIEGFDVEIAKLIAVGIFGGSVNDLGDKVEFVETVSAVREPSIVDGKVDIVVATYTINDARKQLIDFAGPYFTAEQDIMVKADDTSIKSVEDLNGKKVCSAQGSTSLKNIQAKAPRADVSIQFRTYSECAQALGDGRVQAVSTDNAILAGLVADSQGAYKLVKAPFSEEPYGIGLKKGANDFREFLNNRLEEIFENGDWEDAFKRTLGQDSRFKLETPEKPKIDRYTSGGATGATSGTSSTTAKP
jgi:glutamate transport system substrate-binding protein